jgi:hypothetical protein
MSFAMSGLHQYSMRRCPVEWQGNLRVWGRETAMWEPMRTVKKTLDPDNVFNPGRLFRSMDPGPERKFRLTKLVQRALE